MQRSLVPLVSRALIVALLAAAGSAPAVAAVSDWSSGPNVRMRLVAAASDSAGANAAVELELAPGWHTYWRSPGEAGIPPKFDFSGSSNLKNATVGFPPPERLDDGFAVTNIYVGRVVLPLTVEPSDPAAPVMIAVKLDLGVCEEVCIPVTLEASLMLPQPPDDDAEARAIVVEAVGRLPGEKKDGAFDISDVQRTGGEDDEPVFEFKARVPDPAATEIFVEGPSDWYPDVPTRVGGEGDVVIYRVTIDRLGAKTPLAKAAIRFTVVSGGQAMEETVTLD
jgi:suppressor for copper-sensitivity B